MKKEKPNLRLTPFDLHGKSMVDVRYWINTPAGPRPTKRGMAIEQSIVTRLIWGLQKMHADHSSEEAKAESMSRG